MSNLSKLTNNRLILNLEHLLTAAAFSPLLKNSSISSMYDHSGKKERKVEEEVEDPELYGVRSTSL